MADYWAPKWKDFEERQLKASRAAAKEIYSEMFRVREVRWTSIQARQLGCPTIPSIKMKPVAWKWWIQGSFQLFLWIDGRAGQRDRQGAKAKARMSEKQKDYPRSSKGWS